LRRIKTGKNEIVSLAVLGYAGRMLSVKPWRAETVMQLLAGVFACLCLGVIAAGLLHHAGVAAFKSPDSFANVLVATLSFQGATLVMGWIFLKWHGVKWRDVLGLQNPACAWFVLLAAGVMVVMLPVVLGLEQLSVMALEHLGWHPEDQHAVDLLANTHSWGLRAYLVFFAVVLAPAAEEFIFRGVLYPFVKQLGWPRLAWLGVSLLFAAIHVNLPTLLPLFVLALALTWLYEKTDCLLAPIVAHSLFNTANIIILFIQTR
jgi:membrane protease YdiL (CAAX protease family)